MASAVFVVTFPELVNESQTPLASPDDDKPMPSAPLPIRGFKQNRVSDTCLARLPDGTIMICRASDDDSIKT